jgi:RNA polymerase sigma factor (sigma-70 family)
VNERQLLEAPRGGDEDAFGRLVDAHRGALHAHSYRMLGSVPDAEDAVQDALLSAWRGLASFEGRSSLRSWLCAIATNASLRAVEGTDSTIEQEGATLWTLRDGKLVHRVDFGDRADALKAAGLSG